MIKLPSSPSWIRLLRNLTVCFFGARLTQPCTPCGPALGHKNFRSVPLMHGVSLYRTLAPIALSDVSRNPPPVIIERYTTEFPPLF